MYFSSYDEALRAALKQSKGQLTDCKLYIKIVPVDDISYIHAKSIPLQYKIGFTPDNADDAYIYNGEVLGGNLDRIIQKHNDYCSKVAR